MAEAFAPVVIHDVIVIEGGDAALLTNSLPLNKETLERVALLPPKRV